MTTPLIDYEAEVCKLVTLAAGLDYRFGTAGDADFDAWTAVALVSKWDLAAARRVLVEYYAAQGDKPRINPAHITDGIRAVRRRAAETFELPRIPAGVPDHEYPAWLRTQRDAHVAAALGRWAMAGEEPQRALPSAPAVVHEPEQLADAAPRPIRRAIASGVRVLRARRVQLDPARRERARDELDRARPSAEPEPDVIDRARIRARIETDTEQST